jgi:Predicted periplasmic lipoprotein (DUF2279)
VQIIFNWFHKLIKPSENINFTRLLVFLGGAFAVYFSILIGLVAIWYSKNNNVDFHWFNDSLEWRFCDKFGHAYIAFTECRLAINLFNWCGVKNRNKYIYSFILAFTMQSSYEILDGMADNYGASGYDIIANATGCAMVIAQYLIFKKVLMNYQFNFSLTQYAQLRPNMLGNSFWERYFKDYNGQTFWFSFNLRELSGFKIFPSWFMLSIGYGGDGLLGGHDNVWTNEQGHIKDLSNISRASRLYLSFDLNFGKAKTGNGFIDNCLYFFSYIKIPLPGIEFHTEKGLKLRWFCY